MESLPEDMLTLDAAGARNPEAFGKRWRAIVDVYIAKVGQRSGWRLIA